MVCRLCPVFIVRSGPVLFSVICPLLGLLSHLVLSPVLFSCRSSSRSVLLIFFPFSTVFIILSVCCVSSFPLVLFCLLRPLLTCLLCVHQDLVRLAAERKDGSVSQSPVQLQPALGPTGGFDNQETDRMPTCKSPVSSAGDEDWGRMARGREEQVVLAPPKPPIPIIQVPLPAGVR